jgi:hypothetical protein
MKILFGSVPSIGDRRFEILKLAFHPTLQELNQLVSILVNASKRYEYLIN